MPNVTFRLSKAQKIFAAIVLIWVCWFVLFRFIFPGFVGLFAGLGVEIPLPTRIVFTLDRTLGPIGGAMAVVVALVALLVVRRRQRTDARSGGYDERSTP